MNSDAPMSHAPLPAGFVIDKYRIEQVLGSPGAFGITYSAFPTGSGRRVALKELFPPDCVVRDSPSHVVVAQGYREGKNFEMAVGMFRKEAEMLSKLSHPNIVRILDYFETNGTAYLVMEFEYGYDLGTHFRAQAIRLNQNELTNLIFPLLDGLEESHRISCLHRDIKPANIYITRDHRPLLLDFGAARQMIVSQTTPITTILTPGYAPFEQYGTTLPQGPWTDIYAMGAVLHVAMTAKTPPHASDRATGDRYVPLVQRLAGQEYTHAFLEAVDWALRFHHSQRPQSIGQWRTALHAASPVRTTAGPRIPNFQTTAFARNEHAVRKAAPQSPGRAPRSSTSPRWPLSLVVAVFLSVLLIVVLIAWLIHE